ncbi:MAG TPA: hypothetical protein VFE84_05685, partial [Patescibacteria group bacterium]|nr:hypothetical protein [Patescibacteria group bacterium]
QGTLPLEVQVRLPAGGIRLHAGGPDALYRADVTLCAEHTLASAEMAAGNAASVGRLSLSLVRRPGVFVGFGGEHNEMKLDLTPSLPLVLDLRLGEGESVIDLGGLSVRRFHMVAGAGDSRVIFSRPNEQAAPEVEIEGTVGDIGVDLLGNANAASIIVGGGVGSLEVDLSGAWRRDARVEIRGSVGDLLLKLPGDGAEPSAGVRLRVGKPWSNGLELPGYERRGDDLLSEGYDTASPKIDVTVLPGIGSLSVVREQSRRKPSR